MVGAFVGEQFAAPEALEALRAVRREAASGQAIRLSACDPSTSRGSSPGRARARHAGQWVSCRDGIPTAAEGREARLSESSTAKA